MPSQTTENYLKALFFLMDEGTELTITNLSKQLSVTLPTANSMVKKLQEHNWVIYKKYKPIQFTAEGKKIAALIIRKHRLTEMYLTEKMGFGWEEVHDIAEQLEHIHAPKLFDRMDEILGFPSIDPHGSPIPDKSGNIISQSYKPLSQILPGKKVVLKALKESSNEFLIFLNKHNLTLNTLILVLEKEPFDGTMQVCYNNHITKSFSNAICDRLMVESAIGNEPMPN
jgi:DtxR family Mn-dependent transcriptional regulator